MAHDAQLPLPWNQMEQFSMPEFVDVDSSYHRFEGSVSEQIDAQFSLQLGQGCREN